MADENTPARTSRFDYITFSHTAKAINDNMTDHAKALEEVIDQLPPGREKALALTALEESIMWARKGLRDVR